MSDSPALVDTNVLVYALFAESEHHAASRALLDRAQSGQLSLCLALQTLAEFYAVVTDPRRVAVPRGPEEALATVETLAAMPGIALLPVPADALDRLLLLARKYPLRGWRRITCRFGELIEATADWGYPPAGDVDSQLLQ